MTLVGIMQGRLLPPTEGRFQCFPRGRWREEFSLAAQARLDSIEWIYDAFGAAENPLATDAGIDDILTLADRYKVCVVSLCADWLMDFPLVRATPAEVASRVEHLCWLLERCQKARIRHVVLPFVDVSRIQNGADVQAVLFALQRALPTAEKTGVEMHLEAALPPEEFSDLLMQIPHPLVKVNYDSGNSAALGYDVRKEFMAYGERIGSVHLKDRVRGGGTVPCGQGAADFPALFEGLKARHYLGNFVLQIARGISGDELAWAQHNLGLFTPYLRSLNWK